MGLYLDTEDNNVHVLKQIEFFTPTSYKSNCPIWLHEIINKEKI